MSKATFAAIAVTASLSMVTACGGEASSRSNGSGGVTSLTVRSAITPSGSLTGPFLYALDHGFYEEAGLDVEVTDGKGSLSVAKDVGQGNVDIGQVGSPTVAQAVNQGLPLISVAQQYGRGSYGLIVDADSGIEDFTDLAGASVIVSAGSPETVLLPATLDKVGVDPSSVDILNVDAAVKGSTYAGGKGDALGTTVPFFMPLVSDQRASEALPFDDAGISFPDYSLVVRPAFLEKNEDAVRAFVEATLQGAAAAAEDPEGVAESLEKHRPEMAAQIEAQQAQFTAYQDYVCSMEQEGKPVGWHSPQAWEAGVDLLATYDALQGDPKSMDEYFTNEFFEGDDAIEGRTCEGGVAR